jgi:hypothetical protein
MVRTNIDHFILPVICFRYWFDLILFKFNLYLMSYPGGVQVQGSISHGAIDYVNGNIAHINSIFHVNNLGYEVVAESTQVVAGTNHFLHLVGLTDRQQYQITVYVPLQGAPTIIEVNTGHGQFQHQFGFTIEAFHNHHHHGHHHGHHHN